MARPRAADFEEKRAHILESAAAVFAAAPRTAASPESGEMLLADVYRGLGDVPRGSIKELRIIQIFPKTTNLANNPHMGIAGEENGRAILGTVPVEPDGSARLIVPAI